MNTGIYLIEHVESGKVYVGSATDFTKRWNVHRCLLSKGTHHSSHLQSAWNKYGESAFQFRKLVVCHKAHLLEYEQRAIDAYKAASRLHGFNGRADAASMAGYRHSPETRARLRDVRKTQVFSAETRALWSKNRTGRKMPDGVGEKHRLRMLEFKHTEESKSKISAAQIGRKDSIARIEARSKLTAKQAREICELHSSGKYSQAALARDFKLDPSTVSQIVAGKRWGAVTKDLIRPSFAVVGTQRRAVSDETRQKMRAAWAEKKAAGFKRGPHTSAHREKLSVAAKMSWERRKQSINILEIKNELET